MTGGTNRPFAAQRVKLCSRILITPRAERLPANGKGIPGHERTKPAVSRRTTQHNARSDCTLFVRDEKGQPCGNRSFRFLLHGGFGRLGIGERKPAHNPQGPPLNFLAMCEYTKNEQGDRGTKTKHYGHPTRELNSLQKSSFGCTRSASPGCRGLCPPSTTIARLAMRLHSRERTRTSSLRIMNPARYQLRHSASRGPP